MGNLANRFVVTLFVLGLSIASVSESLADVPPPTQVPVASCISVDSSTFYPTTDGRKAGHFFARFIASHKKDFRLDSLDVRFWGDQDQEQLDQRIVNNHFAPNATQDQRYRIALGTLLDTTAEERERLAAALGPEIANAVSAAYHVPKSGRCGIVITTFSSPSLRKQLCPKKGGCAYMCTSTGCINRVAHAKSA